MSLKHEPSSEAGVTVADGRDAEGEERHAEVARDGCRRVEAPVRELRV